MILFSGKNGRLFFSKTSMPKKHDPYLSTLEMAISGDSASDSSLIRALLFLAHAVYVVLDSSRHVALADMRVVVVDTEVDVEDDTNRNLGCLVEKEFCVKKKICRFLDIGILYYSLCMYFTMSVCLSVCYKAHCIKSYFMKIAVF